MPWIRPKAATVAYAVITALLLLTLATGVVRATVAVVGLVRGQSVLAVDLGAVEPLELPPGFEVAGPTPIWYHLDDPTAVEVTLATVPQVLWWLGTLAALWLLRGVARSATTGDPFQPGNVRRLRRLGLLFAAGYPLAVLIEGLMTDRLFSSGVWDPGRPFPDITIAFPVLSGAAMLAAVSLFVLAQVFAHGVRLREDVDATI